MRTTRPFSRRRLRTKILRSTRDEASRSRNVGNRAVSSGRPMYLLTQCLPRDSGTAHHSSIMSVYSSCERVLSNRCSSCWSSRAYRRAYHRACKTAKKSQSSTTAASSSLKFWWLPVRICMYAPNAYMYVVTHIHVVLHVTIVHVRRCLNATNTRW